MPLPDIIAEVQARAAKIEMNDKLGAQVLMNCNLAGCTRDMALEVAAHLVAVILHEEKATPNAN